MSGQRTWAVLALFSLALLGLGFGLYRTHERLARVAAAAMDSAHLTEVRAEAAELQRIHAQLTEQLSTLHQQLDVLKAEQTLLADRHRQQEASVEALREELKHCVSRHELDALNERLAKTEALAQIQTAKPTAHRRLRIPRPTPKPALSPPKPPFTALGLETRGGERFLAVAPSDSRSLRQVRLLRVGEQLGTWRLHTLAPQSAVFAVQGWPDQTLTVR